MAEDVGRHGALQDRRGPRQAEEVRAGDVPVPVGRPPHGPRAQLHHRRRHGAPGAHARLRRPSPDGLRRLRPPRRERRHQAQHPSGQVDPPEHRPGRQDHEAHGLLLRLRPHVQHLRPRVLPVGPVDVPQDVGEGPGLPQHLAGQLVPLLQHGPGQRAGRSTASAGAAARCPRSASSRSGTSRSPTTPRSSSTTSTSSTAGPRTSRRSSANWIGRSEGAEIDFALCGRGRRDAHRPRRSPSSLPARTPSLA